MKNAKNTRSCIVCRQKKDKSQMYRFVVVDKKIVYDKDNQLQGRGCYICKDDKCITECIKKKNFNKVYKTNIDNYEQLNSLK